MENFQLERMGPYFDNACKENSKDGKDGKDGKDDGCALDIEDLV